MLTRSFTVNSAFDPEVATSIIELAQKMMPRYLHNMIRVQNFEKLCDFSLQCLDGPDILPTRAAAYFWVIQILFTWERLLNTNLGPFPPEA